MRFGEVAPIGNTHHLLSNLYGLFEVVLASATFGAALALLLSWVKRRPDGDQGVGSARSTTEGG